MPHQSPTGGVGPNIDRCITAIGISEAADKALKYMKAEKTGSVRTELSHLFHFNKKKADQSKPAYGAISFAYHDQERIPATDAEKEELYQAGCRYIEDIYSSPHVQNLSNSCYCL